uniref:calcium and integrin-binding family member 4-like n=1 Tax=Pristiophorus japonicus TaxID=55135 RepID=UPI00398E4C85
MYIHDRSVADPGVAQEASTSLQSVSFAPQAANTSTGSLSPGDLENLFEMTTLDKSQNTNKQQQMAQLSTSPQEIPKSHIGVHQTFLNLARDSQYLTSEQVRSIPAIKVNPFGDQICKVFSTDKDGLFSFDDFLEMMSAFSENAPLTVKIDYAFRIYDFNDNNYIDEQDIRNIILRLTNGLMDEANILVLIQYILAEADLNNDGMLSFVEFENVISKSPDFQKPRWHITGESSSGLEMGNLNCVI